MILENGGDIFGRQRRDFITSSCRRLLDHYCPSSSSLTSSSSAFFLHTIRQGRHRHLLTPTIYHAYVNSLSFSSSKNTGGQNGDDDGYDKIEDDEEEWIPPQRHLGGGAGHSGSDPSTRNMITKIKPNIITEIDQSKLYTQQRRIDEATDALFVLTPEEEATMTTEEISKRIDEVLALEEELEQQALEMELMQEEAEEEEEVMPTHPVIDWLQTRRAALGVESLDSSSMSPSASSSSGSIPVEKHTLLTCDEIQALLKYYGGHDIVVIEDDPEFSRMGGADGMIFCSSSDSTGSSGYNNIHQQTFRIMTLTRGLVDHMKERQLDEIGVPDAQLSLGKKTQQRQKQQRPSGGVGITESLSSSWQIIDCRNYIVHIMDPTTRANLGLEALWAGKDSLWKLDWTDEDAVDDYVANQQQQQVMNNPDSGSASWDDGRFIHRLERTTFSTTSPRHRPVIAFATKRGDRRAGRKQSRRQREQRHQQQQQRFTR
jgi:Ribosomal silencing factor during starvation